MGKEVFHMNKLNKIFIAIIVILSIALSIAVYFDFYMMDAAKNNLNLLLESHNEIHNLYMEK